MKATVSRKRSRAVRSAKIGTTEGKIHPVIIYPFMPPASQADPCALYDFVGRLAADTERYARPITVMDRKTELSRGHLQAFRRFREKTVSRWSDILDAWCVDTCQMWYAGLGRAFELGRPGDVYWLIPGDFNYGAAVGQEVLGRLHDLPEIIMELEQDICIGEVSVDGNHSKHLIDTYGTFALLYNWFPNEAGEIRQYTERPRSEFFALRHDFLGEMLAKRWYPYEQTVVMLLDAVAKDKRISRFSVGNITDLPGGRESLAAAWQQVERTERVLKSVWRDQNQSSRDWIARYHALEGRSEQVRRTAMTVLQNLLT